MMIFIDLVQEAEELLKNNGSVDKAMSLLEKAGCKNIADVVHEANARFKQIVASCKEWDEYCSENKLDIKESDVKIEQVLSYFQKPEIERVVRPPKVDTLNKRGRKPGTPPCDPKDLKPETRMNLLKVTRCLAGFPQLSRKEICKQTGLKSKQVAYVLNYAQGRNLVQFAGNKWSLTDYGLKRVKVVM